MSTFHLERPADVVELGINDMSINLEPKGRNLLLHYNTTTLILTLRQKQRLAYRLSLHHAAPLTTHASCLDTDTRDLDILKGGGGFRAQRVMDPPPPCAAQAAFCESLSQTFCINLHANAFDAVFCSAEC